MQVMFFYKLTDWSFAHGDVVFNPETLALIAVEILFFKPRFSKPSRFEKKIATNSRK